MRNAWIWIVVVVILIGGGLLWWQNSQPTPASNTTPTVDVTTENTPPVENPVTTPTATTTSTATSSSVKEFTVTSQGMSFTPKTLSVKKGDTVKITYKNGGGTHNLTIDEFGVGTKTISGGASETIEFVADKTGDFQYYCSVGNHRAMGMWGTLTVTP